MLASEHGSGGHGIDLHPSWETVFFFWNRGGGRDLAEAHQSTSQE